MKTYSIGRENGCDIVINDSTDVISRRHAILSVSSLGKMTITDQSHNGTYINGIRISSNVPVPVSRKDSVSFAQIARLDWNLVPNPLSIYKYIAIGILSLLALALLYFGINSMMTGNGENNSNDAPADTTKVVTQEDLAARENARRDSITKAITDSINRVNAKKQAASKEVHPKKKEKEKTNTKKTEQAEEVQQRIR